MNRRDFLLAGAAVLGNSAISSPVKSLLGGDAIGNMDDAKTAITAKSYVQDGLLVLQDGIENVGWGVHDPNATEWVELIDGENNFKITDTTKWTKDALITRPAVTSQTRIPRGVLTLEIVMDWGAWKISSNQMNTRLYIPVANPVVGTYKNTVMLKFLPMEINGQRVFVLGTYQQLPVVGDYFPRHISCSFGLDGVMTDIYFDGEPATLGLYEYQYVSSQVINLGCPNPDGKIHCIRAYEGRISMETREHNYMIDKMRFNLP